MTYTVLSVAPNPRSYDANGPKLDYTVRFTEHSDTDISWSQVPETPAPQTGQSVDGTIDWNAKVRPRFKREFQQKGTVGGSTWKPRDPAETAAIQRQHSQGLAVRTAIAAGWFQDFDPEDDAGKAKLALVSRLATWFQRDIAKGVAVAQQDTASRASYGQRKDTETVGGSDVPNTGVPVHEPAGEVGFPWTGDAA